MTAHVRLIWTPGHGWQARRAPLRAPRHAQSSHRHGAAANTLRASVRYLHGQHR